VKVNLENRVVLLFREADCLAKINLEIPIVALTILAKKDYFTLVTDSLQLIIEEFVCTAKRVKLEVRPLLLPHLVCVASLLEPGLTTLTWTKPDWKDFCHNTKEQIKNFDILITRVHDVYDNRYNGNKNKIACSKNKFLDNKINMCVLKKINLFHNN